MAESNANHSELLERAELSDDAKALFHEELAAPRYVAELSGANLFADAVKYRAHSLERHACVAWSLASIRKLQPEFEPNEAQALDAIDKWLADPTDANRRACKTAADEAQLSTPAGCAAMAVFFSEGSIAPQGLQPVPPPPHLTAKISAGGIILAVVSEPLQAAERYRLSLDLAPNEPK